MSKNKKTKHSLRIPTEQPVTVDKKSIVSRSHHLMAMNLLGDVQKALVEMCSAVRRHREQKWSSGDVDCVIDSQLYTILEMVVDTYEKTSSKGRPARFLKRKESIQ